MTTRRLRSCVEAWPECEDGAYNPRCCRFPKSCSCKVYDPERVSDADLEVRYTTSAVGPDGRTVYFDDLVRDGEIVWVYGDRRADEVRIRMRVRFNPSTEEWVVEDAPESPEAIAARIGQAS